MKVYLELANDAIPTLNYKRWSSETILPTRLLWFTDDQEKWVLQRQFYIGLWDQPILQLLRITGLESHC